VGITPSTPRLGFLGDTLRLTATALDSDGNAIAGKTFAWASSADTVATVSSSGLVTAIAFDTVTITATADGVVGNVLAIVTQVAATISVEPDTVTLTRLGLTRHLGAKAYDAGGERIPDADFTWESSSTDIATVTSSGVVTAAGHGSASVTATAGGVSGAASVTVQLFPHVDVTPAGAAIPTVGATQTFVAEVWDADGNQVRSPAVAWSSFNPNVATIDATTGVATAVASGQATIAAEVNGQVGSALLTVSVPGLAAVSEWSLEFPLRNYSAIWGASSTDVFAVGTSGTIQHYDGAGWGSMSSGTTNDLYGVWGTSTSDVFAVGDSGTILTTTGLRGRRWRAAPKHAWFPCGVRRATYTRWVVTARLCISMGPAGTQ